MLFIQLLFIVNIITNRLQSRKLASSTVTAHNGNCCDIPTSVTKSRKKTQNAPSQSTHCKNTATQPMYETTIF